MSSFRWVRDDTQAKPFSIKNGDGTVYDLTACTVTFSMRLRNAHSNKVTNGSVTITTASTGECEYRWAGTDVDTCGTYDGWIIVSNGGKPIHTERFVIRIVEAWEE